jgi:putative transposase
MRKARWLAEWAGKQGKPAIYHCISRVVDRRFVFGDGEREAFRMFMRMQENFTGCRVLTYCVMSNHFHVLLEVPPVPEGGLSDELLLKRLGALYSEAFVDGVAKELESARKEGDEAMVAEIHARFTYRMHDLSEFMKTLLQRFTRWFNREHNRRGTLWEERYKSVIVESGVAARTIAAYIDLNPVRAGMVSDPAEYRWSSYGEAVGGGAKGNGKKAREGLVRACMSHKGAGFEAEKWKEVSRIYRRAMGLALGRKTSNFKLQISNKRKTSANMNEEEMLSSKDNETVLPDLGMAAMLMKRVRYFTDGAVIGSKEFVNEAFAGARERFSERRKDGARRMRGSGKAAAGTLWSMRDLRVGGG